MAAQENLAGRTAQPLTAARVQELRRFVEGSRQTLGIPGMAVGVLQDGKVVLAEGFGVRMLGRPEPVDEHTRFLIASNTKPLTSLMMAKLIGEGLFSWDTPATALLPQLRLGDEQTTGKLQVRHFLCACTGLPYRNLDWEFAPDRSAATLPLAILARMRPTTTFGTTYSYSNPISAAGGYAGAHAAYPGLELGVAYDRAMATRVFDPLGMRNTTFDFSVARRGNYARSHGIDPLGRLGVVENARERQIHAVRPTGGAWSSVNDMLRWVNVELSGGVLPSGKRFISERHLKARWSAGVSTGPYSWYGLGLETTVESGTPVVFHGGRLYGFRGDAFWLPEHRVGAVILMNSSSGEVLMQAFRRRLMELLFDLELKAQGSVARSAAAHAEQRRNTSRTLTFPADRAASARLAPLYRNDLHGEIRVDQSKGQTIFDFGAWRAPVASRTGPDGQTELVLITPTAPQPFRAGTIYGRRSLTISDGRNKLVYKEVGDDR